MEIYNLTPALYDKIDNFYNTYKSSNGLIQSTLVIELLNNIAKNRNGKITATEDDIVKTTNLIDQDKDGYMNFNELIDLLNLLLTDNRKIEIRIKQYLTNKDRLNSINRIDACDNLAFLNQFYSPNPASIIRAHKQFYKSNKLFDVLNKLNLENGPELKAKIVFGQETMTTKHEFSRQLSKYYNESAYVLNP